MTPDERRAVSEWVDEFAWCYSELAEASALLGSSAGTCARIIDGTIDGDLAYAFDDVTNHASNLLVVVEQARAIPQIPEPETARLFDAGLAVWWEAAKSMKRAAEDVDGELLKRSAGVMEAGTDDFLRSAAALRRATGQSPDPQNPFS